jgi:ribosomal-protein-alanine N-acetyltransferase
VTNFPELNTNKLKLRAIKETDAHSLALIYSDAETMYYRGSPTTFSQEDIEIFVQEKINWFKAFKGIYWVITDSIFGELIGYVDLYWLEDKWELEYCILKEHRRKGYATEAVSKVISFCKENEINIIYAKTKKINIVSIRLLKNLNFKFEGMTYFFDKGIEKPELGSYFKLILD